MTLAETLRALSAAMPGGRIRVETRRASAGIPQLEQLSLVMAGQAGRVAYLHGDGLMTTNPGNSWELPLDLMQIEYALREEIEARGWHWKLEAATDGPPYAEVNTYQASGKHWGAEHPPVHALAAAFLSALKAQRPTDDRTAYPESKFDAGEP